MTLFPEWDSSGNIIGRQNYARDLPLRIKVGQVYLLDTHHVVLLSQVMGSKVCLIGIDGGNRYLDPVHVVQTTNITKEEFMRACGWDEKEVDVKYMAQSMDEYIRDFIPNGER